MAAASRRGHLALGYTSTAGRMSRHASDGVTAAAGGEPPAPSLGSLGRGGGDDEAVAVLNPRHKGLPRCWLPGDRVIVLCRKVQ